MARKNVLCMVTADKMVQVNAYMVGLYGDPPESQYLSLNAYLDGEDESVGTHSISNSNVYQADADTLESYVNAVDGCGAAQYPLSPPPNLWANALSLWNLKPAVTQVP